jgi:hypothetical protein
MSIPSLAVLALSGWGYAYFLDKRELRLYGVLGNSLVEMAPAYNHRQNTTNAPPNTVAVTNAASTVATNTKAILPCLGQLF